MNDQLSNFEETYCLPHEESNDLLAHEHRIRRFLEMQRRMQGLHVKRNHLRNELQSVEKCLTSLDGQMKTFQMYEKSSINKNNKKSTYKP